MEELLADAVNDYTLEREVEDYFITKSTEAAGLKYIWNKEAIFISQPFTYSDAQWIVEISIPINSGKMDRDVISNDICKITYILPESCLGYITKVTQI